MINCYCKYEYLYDFTLHLDARRAKGSHRAVSETRNAGTTVESHRTVRLKTPLLFCLTMSVYATYRYSIAFMKNR